MLMLMKVMKRLVISQVKMSKQIQSMPRIDLKHRRKLEKAAKNNKELIIDSNKRNNCFYKLILFLIVS